MNESERLLNEKICDYYRTRYRVYRDTNDIIDWIHSPDKTMELIQELVFETGGIHLDMVGAGVFRCRTDRYEAVGGKATWGRTIAETFADFIEKRKVKA